MADNTFNGYSNKKKDLQKQVGVVNWLIYLLVTTSNCEICRLISL